mgnify:CR=1 FL=1
MKMTFRRPVSLSLALALAASALAGCGESQTTGADLPEGAVSLVLSDDGITVDELVREGERPEPPKEAEKPKSHKSHGDR